MRVLLLGATGRTGKLILKQMIAQGHLVNAIVRDKTRVKLPSQGLTVLEGSTLDDDLLTTAIRAATPLSAH